jgi:hypothetical protein
LRDDVYMDLTELANTLPNGLHDLLVDRLSIDFLVRVLTLEVSVWTGDLAASDAAEREARRNGMLRLDGLVFCVFDPPDPKYPHSKAEALWLVDFYDPDPAVVGERSVPEGAFSHRFFVQQWNAFIHVAARSASLDWCP